MKKIIATTLCFAFIATSRSQAADGTTEKTLTKSFTVEPGGEINVDADQGDIEVITASQNTVNIVVERDVPGASEAQTAKALKAHKVVFSQDGKTIRVEATTAKASHGLFSSAQPDLQIHFRITVPQRFDATLNTAGGNIKITNLAGAVDARTSGGDLSFSKIQGPVDAHTSGGNVRALSCADKLTIQTSGGNIVIKDFTGSSAQADTSGGNVEATGCSGRLQVKSSGGNINIEDFSGASAYADTSGGSISVGVTKAPTGDCWFSTSGGNVTVRLPEDAGVNLHARTEGGTVDSKLPVTVEGKQKDGVLDGKINGGGPNLALKTSGGNIEVLKL